MRDSLEYQADTHGTEAIGALAGPTGWILSAVLGPVLYVVMLGTKQLEWAYLLPGLLIVLFHIRHKKNATPYYGYLDSDEQPTITTSRNCGVCNEEKDAHSYSTVNLLKGESLIGYNGLLEFECPNRWDLKERIALSVCATCAINARLRSIAPLILWAILLITSAFVTAWNEGVLTFLSGLIAMICVVKTLNETVHLVRDGGPVSQTVLNGQSKRVSVTHPDLEVFSNYRLKALNEEGFEPHESDENLRLSVQSAMIMYPTIAAACVATASILINSTI